VSDVGVRRLQTTRMYRRQRRNNRAWSISPGSQRDAVEVPEEPVSLGYRPTYEGETCFIPCEGYESAPEDPRSTSSALVAFARSLRAEGTKLHRVTDDTASARSSVAASSEPLQ